MQYGVFLVSIDKVYLMFQQVGVFLREVYNYIEPKLSERKFTRKYF